MTLIIPEGAVQHPTTIWFGACLFSDKFNFHGYVPITPIVWIYIDKPLEKCAELCLPHNIANICDEGQFTVLTANDEYSSLINFYASTSGTKSEGNIFQIECIHFCSNCVAVQKKEYNSIPKQYLIARAEKKNGRKELTVQYIFLCLQQGCKKVLAD